MTHTQGDFFTMLKDHEARGRARATDPDTSKAAAKAVTPEKRTDLQRRILRAFDVMGDMHDQEVLDAVHTIERNLGIPEDKLSSPSGVRSRRSELSKPNMERLDELAVEMGRDRDLAWPVGRALGDTKAIHGYASLSEHEGYVCPVTHRPLDRATAIARLRGEGFRSPLWDTGKRLLVKGSNVIVWGVAK